MKHPSPGRPRVAAAATIATLTAATIILAAALHPAPAAADDLIPLARAFDATWNAGDAAKIATLFTDDATIAFEPLGPGQPFVGKEAIAGWIAHILPGFHVESTDYRQDGNSVSWHFRVRADFLDEGGVTPLEGVTTATFEGKRVKTFRPKLGAETLGKMAVQRFAREVLAAGDVAVIDELVAPDYIEHEELAPGAPAGREGLKQTIKMFRAAFPDLHADIQHLVAEGDLVVVAGTWNGTHKGEFAGVPATGNTVSFGVVDILRFRDGVVVEHWGTSDNMALMQQIGALPAHDQAAH